MPIRTARSPTPMPDRQPIYPRLDQVYRRLDLPEQAARVAAAAKEIGIKGHGLAPTIRSSRPSGFNCGGCFG